MKLSIMAAVSENQALGKDGQLVWHLPADQRYLEEHVRGRVAIMGRVSYEGFRSAYQQTRCLVISRQSDLPLAAGDRRVSSFAEAVAQARELVPPAEEVFVLGGAGVYAEALPQAAYLYLTRVHATVEADTFFPPVDFSQWRLQHEQPHPADAEHEYAFTFLRYQRRES